MAFFVSAKKWQLFYRTELPKQSLQKERNLNN